VQPWTQCGKCGDGIGGVCVDVQAAGGVVLAGWKVPTLSFLQWEIHARPWEVVSTNHATSLGLRDILTK